MNVSLSIVGGTSNSFVYDLYNARYVKRNEVEVKEEATLAPPVLEVCCPHLLSTSHTTPHHTTPHHTTSHHITPHHTTPNVELRLYLFRGGDSLVSVFGFPLIYLRGEVSYDGVHVFHPMIVPFNIAALIPIHYYMIR